MFPLALLTHLRFLGILMAGAYGLINVLLEALALVTDGWTHWGTTLLAVPVMVLAMVHLVIPFARRGGK
ncbi:hypothetical protein [Aquabacter cavernae]|uniref:hypothetical protein n=1 Tax=Aquabacter cavernae TaxID=2496029 RepID=UPI000F8DFA5F|nr:hypothetical protein [Aquabacter cavernae]